MDNLDPTSDQEKLCAPAPAVPFWSDDFDMDLLKVFPNVPKMLANPDRVLWTVCSHLTHGRINCPVTWNGTGSLLWLTKPNLPRDRRGWFNVQGRVSDAHEAECTWLEWLRDMWCHQHLTFFPEFGNSLPAVDWNDCFYPIMAALRGWHKQDVSEPRKRALHWIMRCDFILNSLLRAAATQKPVSSDVEPQDSGGAFPQ